MINNFQIKRWFFRQILFHFPGVVTDNSRPVILIVDAGMCQLNNTGYMYNRVRMITSGFLCKHLLNDWRWINNFAKTDYLEKIVDYDYARQRALNVYKS